MAEYYTRMGDGKRVLLSKQQILDDIFEGTADAADMGEIPQLNDGEMEHIALPKVLLEKADGPLTVAVEEVIAE